MNISRLALAAALLAAGAGLSAQDLHFGGQLTLSLPQDDLDTAMDGRLGYGLGAHLFVPLKDGHALVPRVDYVMYKREVGSVDLEFNVLNVGADYNYYISQKAGQGFYVLAGAAYSSARAKVTGVGSHTESDIAIGAGAGYMFTPNLGAELRYTHVKYDEAKCSAIQASFVCRF